MASFADIVHNAVHGQHDPDHNQPAQSGDGNGTANVPPATTLSISDNHTKRSSSPERLHINGDASPLSPSSPSSRRKSLNSYKDVVPQSPQFRTGPPRSLSYGYGYGHGPQHPSGSTSQKSSRFGQGTGTDTIGEENPDTLEVTSQQLEDQERPRDVSNTEDDEDMSYFDFTPRLTNDDGTPFRGALEFHDPQQLEREREMAQRRAKRRDSSSVWQDWRHKLLPESLAESPRSEHRVLHFARSATELRQKREEDAERDGEGGDEGEGGGRRRGQSEGEGDEEPSLLRGAIGRSWGKAGMSRSYSMPLKEKEREKEESGGKEKEKGKGKEKSHGNESTHSRANSSTNTPTQKWSRLRTLLPRVASQARHGPISSTVAPTGVNVTDELIAGGLSTLMLRLWFERDEKEKRRVPILFHRLRIRISDSLHPLHGTSSVFRIECEYANGAARWVIYRQLKDFLSLHTHYAVSNAYNRNQDILPEFPRTSKFIPSPLFTFIYPTLSEGFTLWC